MHRLAHLYLRLRGWRFDGTLPPQRKFVVVGAPHTSNWDFVVFLGTLHHFGIRARFLGKHSLFRWPFGGLMRRLGGIPVRRDKPGALARDVAAAFDDTDTLVVVIAPAGTRGTTTAWKSGFYRIAKAADVPVVPAFVDLGGRRAAIGPAITMIGEPTADMDRIRAFFAAEGMTDERGLPSVRIREEDAPHDDA